ncbi:GNAT family N-acetyltransferase [Sphaerimonospora thailandensis]|uniref:N-acetyltransferase domain-containing protein n=1 Tax=Sphaerimonospora thailandensis TaxID=795644 RepID=A0A8J3R435_9ACTN|nr:GNAT family N-acetyltransferase [Sphaerimonospora thailandensis]GIH68752.1 hypothetical protein Mth01_10050 [Sphaerimonospora thailandensis]
MRANTLSLPARLTLTPRRATPDDLRAVLGLLAETARWLDSLGVRQWPAEGFPAGRIEPLIGAGAMYVLDDDAVTGALAATMALDGHADPEFWLPADRPADALYVHKLAVSRAHAGEGLGEALLAWAALRAGTLGRRLLRLDCAKDNARLQAYYRDAGFRHVRTVDLPHRASGALFERRASGVPAPRAAAGPLLQRAAEHGPAHRGSLTTTIATRS